MDQTYRLELAHHGIRFQKWGKRNGPPYPLKDSQKSKAERKAEKSKQTMTDEELAKATERLKSETAYQKAVNEYLEAEKKYKEMTAKGKSKANEWFAKNGTQLINNAINTGITQLAKPALENALKKTDPYYGKMKVDWTEVTGPNGTTKTKKYVKYE